MGQITTVAVFLVCYVLFAALPRHRHWVAVAGGALMLLLGPFGLGIDLSDLDRQAENLIASIDAKIDELEKSLPQVSVRSYLAKLAEEFEERPFLPLDDVWERELGDIFDDLTDD